MEITALKYGDSTYENEMKRECGRLVLELHPDEVEGRRWIEEGDELKKRRHY